MNLTKDNLKQWLDSHPAISPREICKEAELHTEAITHLYNSMNRNLTEKMKGKLLPVLNNYGGDFVL